MIDLTLPIYKICIKWTSYIKGLKDVNRAVISHMEGKDGQYNMIVDGADLAGVLATPGIDWRKTYSNHTPKVSFILRSNFENLKIYFVYLVEVQSRISYIILNIYKVFNRKSGFISQSLTVRGFYTAKLTIVFLILLLDFITVSILLTFSIEKKVY